MNVEAAYAIHAFKLLESIERDLAGARNELKKFGPLFLVKRPDCSPEPLDLLR